METTGDDQPTATQPTIDVLGMSFITTVIDELFYNRWINC